MTLCDLSIATGRDGKRGEENPQLAWQTQKSNQPNKRTQEDPVSNKAERVEMTSEVGLGPRKAHHVTCVPTFTHVHTHIHTHIVQTNRMK